MIESKMLLDSFIFVPAYNVENTLCNVLSKIPADVWRRAKVLVINDGSKDGTESAYERFAEKFGDEIPEAQSRLEYFCFEKNSGYGAVVKKGLGAGIASGAKFVVCLHGDGQYPADMLDQFLNHLENFRCDDGAELSLLQGSRHAVAGGAKAGNMPLHKRLGGAFLTAVENVVLKQKLTDRHSGFILYRTDFLKTLDLENLSPSFDIDLELIGIADSQGLRMGELPIPTVYGDEKSNLNVVSYGLRCLRLVIRRLLKK